VQAYLLPLSSLLFQHDLLTHSPALEDLPALVDVDIDIATLVLEALDQPLAKPLQALKSIAFVQLWMHTLQVHDLDAFVFEHRPEVEVIEELVYIARLRVGEKLAMVKGNRKDVELRTLEHKHDVRVLLVDDFADAMHVVDTLVREVDALDGCEAFGSVDAVDG
jgi:hypothetical protein